MRHSSWPLYRVSRVLALTLVAPVIIAACSVTPSGPPAVAPMAVQTAPVASTTIVGTVAYSGNVLTRAKISLLPKIAGQITALNVDTGSVVKEGDVIAELDHAVQDAQVAQANAGVAVAKVKLAAIQAGPRAELVAQARTNLQAAQANLAFMQGGGRAESVDAAQGNLASAAGRLSSLQQGRGEAIAQATANVQAAQSRLQELKNGPTTEQIHVAELAVEQAKDAANAANVSKDAACNPVYPAAACNAAQAGAFAAQTGIDQAQARLKILTSPPTAEQLKQAQAAVDAAQAQLQLAQHPGSSGDVAAAQGAVAAAQAQLDLAKSPFSTADLARGQAAVDIAEQQLKLTESPFTQQDQDAARAAVAQAEAAVQSATVARDQAIVRSPMNGIVADKPLSVGSLAAPGSPIVILIDPAVDVVVNADAAQGDALKLGGTATITSDSLPGKSIPGTIAKIYPTVDPQARTVKVKIAPTSQDSGLKDGMLAQVTIVTATHDGVLAVPNAAIVLRGGQSIVYVVTDGVARPMVVQVGLSDGTATEITSGLQLGQLVVISSPDRLGAAQPVVVQK